MFQTGLFCSGHTIETSYNPEAKNHSFPWRCNGFFETNS